MFIKRILVSLGIMVLGIAAYLCLWPVPADPVSWAAPIPPGYSGAFAANNKLANLNLIELGQEVGPEHIAKSPDGKLYAAMENGSVVQMDLDGKNPTVFASTGGRVLGLDFEADGRMIVADAMKGLLAIASDKTVSVLSDQVEPNDPIGYANSVVVAPDGKIYFTDSSTRFRPIEWGGTYQASVLDVLEQSATGRVLVYDPEAKKTSVVARGLSFANGIGWACLDRATQPPMVCQTNHLCERSWCDCHDHYYPLANLTDMSLLSTRLDRWWRIFKIRQEPIRQQQERQKLQTASTSTA